MSLYPFLRSPFTDLTATIVNHQQYDKCGPHEIKMLECLEAYGIELGKKKCKDIIEDFQECVGMRKQISRIAAMQAERERQVKAGERTEKYALPPRQDAY